MTFDNNIPVSGQSLGSTRTQINTNFSLIASVFANNHEAFNDGDEGKHKFMQMPEQAAAPATAASEGGFYTKDANGKPQLFYRNEGSGSEYQLTHVRDAGIAEFGTNTTYSGTLTGGWTFLPGGLIMNYGQSTVTSSGTTITYALQFPSGNPAFSITTSVLRATGSGFTSLVRPASSLDTGFDYVSGGGSAILISWMAIGN